MTYGLRDLGGRLVELCDECGFDGREDIDLVGRLTAGYAAVVWLTTREGSDHRPSEGTWSAVEYGDHLVEVTAGILAGCMRALGAGDVQPVTDLASAREVAVRLAVGLTVMDRGRSVDIWPFGATVDAACQHLLHDLEHHVLDIRRGLASLGLALGSEVVTTLR